MWEAILGWVAIVGLLLLAAIAGGLLRNLRRAGLTMVGPDDWAAMVRVIRAFDAGQLQTSGGGNRFHQSIRHFGLGEALRLQHLPAEAARAYERSAELAPDGIWGKRAAVELDLLRSKSHAPYRG